MRKRLFVLPIGRRRRAPATGGGAEAPQPFDPRTREELWWRQSRSSRHEWRLEAGGRCVAAIRREHLFSGTSHARFADAAFVLRRGWTGNIEARAEGAPELRGLFRLRWNGDARVELPGEEAFEFAQLGFWNRAFELRTRDGHRLVRIESHHGFARHEAQVLLEDPARRRADLPLLLALVTAHVFAPKRHSS